MNGSRDIKIYQQASWRFSAILAALQCLALLVTIPYFAKYADSPYNATDEKLGAFLAIMFAVLVYLVQLVATTPFLVMRCKASGHRFGTRRDFLIFLPLLVGPAFFLLLFAAFTQHFVAFSR
jgi:hypothetical protein